MTAATLVWAGEAQLGGTTRNIAVALHIVTEQLPIGLVAPLAATRSLIVRRVPGNNSGARETDSLAVEMVRASVTWPLADGALQTVSAEDQTASEVVT